MRLNIPKIYFFLISRRQIDTEMIPMWNHLPLPFPCLYVIQHCKSPSWFGRFLLSQQTIKNKKEGGEKKNK